MTTVVPGAAPAAPDPRPEDVWARRSALAVAALGLVVVVIPALLHLGGVLLDDPFAPRFTRVSVTRNVDGKIETETTISPEEQSLVERTLSSGGLLLLRLGVVSIAAFMAGAVVQRIVAMDFSGKFGPVELSKLSQAAGASSATLEEVTHEVGRQTSLLRRVGGVAADAARRVADLEKRVDKLTPRRPGRTRRSPPIP